MSHDRASRGVPLPTFWQWLVVVAAVGAIALIWMELRRPRTDFGGIGPGDAEEGSIAAALENLRMVEAIAQTGPDGVPELAAALADSNPRLRRNALLALRLMGVEAGEALILVRARLTDEDTQVRSCAIDAYWRICRDPADVAAVVAPMLGDPDGRVRETAAKVLETIGRPAIGPLVALLKTSMPVARIPTLKVLRRIGWDAPQPQIDDVVRNFVRDADPNVSIDALRTLAAWGRTTPSEIAELLQHQDAAERIMSEPNPREAALTAIIRQGSDAAENLNDVLDLLAEDQCGWQQWDLSLAALRAMQSAARPAVPRLLQFANKCQDYRRIDVGWLLLSIGVDPQEIVRMTTPLLLDKDTDLCFHAGRLCAIASPDDARRQVTSLILQLAPEKLAERSSALNAVWGLAREAQEAIPTLSRLLECEQPHVARVAAKALGDIGPEAAPAIPALLAQLARGREVHDYGARSAFCEAIGKMGPAARDAVPALLVELNDAAVSRASAVDINRVEERSFFNEVLSALVHIDSVHIGNGDPDVLAAIRRHLANEDEHKRISAIRALARLTPASPEILSLCLEWLGAKGRSQYSIGVILAIGRLPGDRRAAVTSLIALLTESDPEICKAAAWTLGKIGPEASTALPSLKAVLKDWKVAYFLSHGRFQRPRRSPGDNPRTKLDRERWVGQEDSSLGAMNDIGLQEKSIAQVVREAIAEIEVSIESDPPPVRN